MRAKAQGVRESHRALLASAVPSVFRGGATTPAASDDNAARATPAPFVGKNALDEARAESERQRVKNARDAAAKAETRRAANAGATRRGCRHREREEGCRRGCRWGCRCGWRGRGSRGNLRGGASERGFGSRGSRAREARESIAAREIDGGSPRAGDTSARAKTRRVTSAVRVPARGDDAAVRPGSCVPVRAQLPASRRRGGVPGRAESDARRARHSHRAPREGMSDGTSVGRRARR